MPLFRRKNSSVPPPGPQPQQHWVAYVYAPQPHPMPSMYALQSPPGPYVQHPTFHATPTARYAHGHLGMQYRTPVQYIPQHSSNPQTPRKRPRSQSGSHAAPSSRASDYPCTDDEYVVDIRTHPAKHGVFSTLVNFARGRSKSRGRNEPDPTARPRSRGGFVDDGHERGRTTDPRYVDDRPKRPLSRGELKRAKHESQKSFEKAMMDKLEENLRGAPLQQEDPYRVLTSVHRASTKDALKHKYEAEDRLQRQSQPVQIPSMHSSSRHGARSPDSIAESPTVVAHTELNARRFFHRQSADSGYHTDAPPRSSRRSSIPLQMQRLDLASPIEKPAAALKIPEGFFNKRGDQLMNSKGDVLRRPPHLEFPPEFAAYPPPGTGWMDHKGQVSRSDVVPSTVLTHLLDRLSARTSGGSERSAEGHCSLAKPPDPRRSKSNGDVPSEEPLCSLVLSFSLSNPTLITHRCDSKTRKSKAFSCLLGC
jgi:hypothetical protein